MAGGLEILGLLALLVGACEIVCWLFPRRLVDEMQEIFGDIPAGFSGGPIHANQGPLADPVDAARRRGAL